MAHDFAAARPAAQHCTELLKRGPRPEERAAMVAAWRRDLARTLADDLSPLLSGDRLEVSILEPEALTGAEALRRIGDVAANSLVRCGASSETALLSFDFATALALTDRSFGGEGRITGGIPDALPRSAALMVDEAAARIAAALTRVSHGDTPPPAPSRSEGGVIIRSESAARLKPFALESACVLVPIIIANRQGCEWRASLAMGAERLDRLLPGSGRRTAPRGPRTSATGMAAPFAGIPLPLHVVVAEFELSLSRLNSLNPGDSIPITMGRQVPLKIGETVLAHGSIGTAEDHMAIRLTRIPLPDVAQGFAR
jgi:flagellar motor switch/type III secretory pathway protein FliN